MTKELEFLIKTVKSASTLITEEFEVKAKGDKGDLVTNFDYEIEEYIINEIKKEYPSFDIVSEEFNSNQGLTDNCFTIDPIDGTVNFAHGIPLWAIQTACIKNGKTCAAVIYIPKLNELYYADENGAYLNNKKISVNNLPVGKGLYTIEGPTDVMLCEYKMNQVSDKSRAFHCAAVDFAFVACGRLSAANFIWDTLWDYVPGQYIAEQAGAVIYNNTKIHIAANSKEFLDVMIQTSTFEGNEELTIINKQ